MALTISLDTFNVNLTTGVASATDTTTGYGTRSNYGVAVAAYKSDYTGATTAIPTSGNNNNPQTDTQWTWSYTVGTDGWYQMWYVAAPLWTAGTYNLYDVVYYAPTQQFYQSLIASNTSTPNVANWAVTNVNNIVSSLGTVTNPNNLNGTVGAATILHTILWAQTTYNYGSLCGNASLEPCTDCKRNWDVTQIQMLRVMLDGLIIASQRQDYSNGEKICRRAISVAMLPSF